MHGQDINPLILDAVKRHCNDDKCLEKVIIDMMNETNQHLQHHHYDSIEWPKHFKKRYRESILTRFKGEPKDA